MGRAEVTSRSFDSSRDPSTQSQSTYDFDVHLRAIPITQTGQACFKRRGSNSDTIAAIRNDPANTRIAW